MQTYAFVGYDCMGNPIVVPTNLPPGNVIGGQASYVITGGSATNQAVLNDQATALDELSTLHNTLLVNGQLTTTGTGDDQAAQLPTYVQKKPWLDAPPGAVPFDTQSAIVLPAVGSGGVVSSHLVPDGYDGVINAYSCNFTGGSFIDGSGDLQFQILRNGAPIRNYDNILTQRGTVGIPRPISPLRIYSGQLIQIVVNHLANVALNGNVVASLVGYDYPSES